jgi:nitrilase
MFVVGLNSVLHADQIPAAFPHREQLVPPGYLEQNGPWLDEGNTVIIAPNGRILAGPVREKEETLLADLDLGAVLTGCRHMDPAGHYNRPDSFRLQVDTSARPAFVEHSSATEPGTSPAASPGDLPNAAPPHTKATATGSG